MTDAGPQTSEEALLDVIDALEACGVPYMLVGSFASNFYGIGRSTKDVDFVLQLDEKSVSDVLKELGPQFRLDSQVSFETVTGTMRWAIDVVALPFRIEFFLLSRDPHDQERFRRRRCAKIAGRDTYLPTPEDVIITKLRWSRQGERPKDRDDVRNVIAVQGDRIDWDYVGRWCERHETGELLKKIRDSIPPIEPVARSCSQDT